MNPFDKIRSKIEQLTKQCYDEIEPQLMLALAKDIWNSSKILDHYEQLCGQMVVERLKGVEETIGDDTLPTELGEMTNDYISSDDDDDAQYEALDENEIANLVAGRAPKTQEVLTREYKFLLNRWSLKRLETETDSVINEMRAHYGAETFRKKITSMWKIAKSRGLFCTEHLEQVKAQANFDTITQQATGIANNQISSEQYAELIKIMKEQVDGCKLGELTPETLFLFGLPARRGADLQAMYVVDSVELKLNPNDAFTSTSGDTKNYIVRSDAGIRFVFNIQKTKSNSNYELDELSFLPRYDEVKQFILDLPEGKLLSKNYYSSTIDATGLSPTNWRHYWFEFSKRSYNHQQWMKVTKCMNSSIAQAVTYCT